MIDTKAIEAAESLDNAAEVTETREELKSRLEAEIRAEYEAAVDKRVTQAVKKVEKKYRAAREAALAQVQEKDKEKAAKEQAEAAEREYKLKLRNARLVLCDVIAERKEYPAEFRSLIPVTDLLEIDNDTELYRELKNRVRNLYVEFNKVVAAEAQKQKALYTK